MPPVTKQPVMNAGGDPAPKGRLPKRKENGEPDRPFLLLSGVHFDHTGYHKAGDLVLSNQDLVALHGVEKFRPLFPYGNREQKHNSRVFETDEQILASEGYEPEGEDNHPNPTPPPPPKAVKKGGRPKSTPVVESPNDGEGQIALADMSIEQLKLFANKEDINVDNCKTKDDFVKTITSVLQE
jgi:hypothetical protein